MPVADAAVVELVARRPGGLVGELARLREMAAGLLGSGVGWSGSAELAFRDSFADGLVEFGPVLARLDEYAAALAGYARELAVVEPGLRAVRARLAAVPEDPGAVAGFESCWRDWDAARRRCVTRLQATTPVVGQRHRWSGFTGAVCGVLEHGVGGLADCSRLLGELGQGLVAAGLVCALVCPPLAGPVWATVAVVAVCQLAVDAARRERGEPVGWTTLGWDAAAALPAGRAVRRVHVTIEEFAEVRTAAQADAAIRRLPKRLRSSPLAPGGGLEAHEGNATHRGHTILKHIKETDAELIQRFETEPNLVWSSSFIDRRTAEASIAVALDRNRPAIERWLNQPRPWLEFEVDVGTEIGRSVSRSGTIVKASKVRVVLRREKTVLGYYIKTAYPTP